MNAQVGTDDGGRPGTAGAAAERQSSLPAGQVLNSGTAGVVVERVAQVRAGHAAEARAFADGLARRLDEQRPGAASMLVYEETFGTRDRLHVLLHLDSFDTYHEVLGAQGDEAQDGWNRLFVEGSAKDVVLLPQFHGMYGAKVDDDLQSENAAQFKASGVRSLPPARNQTDIPDDALLHSGNAGIVIRRSCQMVYDFRAEARQFGREVAASINSRMQGECTIFIFEEAFGPADQLHWMIHLKDLSSYMKLIALHVSDDPEIREIYLKERIAPEKGGGTWARTFVEGTMGDCAFHALGGAR
jgi:hypothetical protein